MLVAVIRCGTRGRGNSELDVETGRSQNRSCNGVCLCVVYVQVFH